MSTPPHFTPTARGSGPDSAGLDPAVRSAIGIRVSEEAQDVLQQRVHIEMTTSSRRRKLVVRALQVGILVLMLGLWQWLASGSSTLKLTVSTPSDVASWLASWAAGGPLPHGSGWSDLGVTLSAAADGYLLGVASGIVLGAVFGSSRWVRSFVAPFIAMLNAFPKIALAPLFLLIFGGTLLMKVSFVAAGTFFLTFYAVFDGIRSIDVVLLQNVRVLGASRLWLIREVYIPAIVGWVTAGLRLTVAWAIASAVIVEYLAANAGIGFIISNGQQTGNVPECFGGIFIIAVVALVVDRLLNLVSRYFTRWRQA